MEGCGTMAMLFFGKKNWKQYAVLHCHGGKSIRSCVTSLDISFSYPHLAALDHHHRESINRLTYRYELFMDNPISIEKTDQ